MRPLTSALLVLAVAAAVAAQVSDPPISDARLTVHTLVREDVFAGFLDDDMKRFARAERNIGLLLEQRPDQRANLLAWQGGTALYRAVVAHEAGKSEEFQQQFKKALENFAEASKLDSGSDGVPAITGGSFALFGDRLPAEQRATAWSQAYAAYSTLWVQQEKILDKLPVHMRGELLAGLAQSAQRTGRSGEATQYVGRMLEALRGTPYEAMANQWNADPAAAANTNLTCKTCHSPGRLTARLAALVK